MLFASFLNSLTDLLFFFEPPLFLFDANNTLATNPAPPNIRTRIKTHSYKDIVTRRISVLSITAASIRITEIAVNTFDANELVANIHIIPIISGTITRPELIRIPATENPP